MEHQPRCRWANPNNPRYVAYHDKEWGVPCHDDHLLFEMLTLECFQAGLTWECVLNKREAFRTAYDDFDVQQVAHYDDAKRAELLANKGIIRHRLKINASTVNAQCFMAIQKEWGSFSNYLWHFTEGEVVHESCLTHTTSPLSDCISKDLIKRGMKFVGSTTVYAYLQAVGVINGHEDGCHLHQNK